ncbi:ABC transporter substrate-binding protein [Flavobacteriaceae bacterium Ap0902]|nr:ABC transporter substrate-binding protein [Flavobacteriaceae bacterium Ap0902]
MRIISLVPSITELLFDLGLKYQIIGRTKFCVHPHPEVNDIQRFGGTKNIHLDRIKEAKADLIIANKEENLKSEIEELQQTENVLITDISTLEENNAMIREIGRLTHSTEKAEVLIDEINHAFDTLEIIKEKHTALYLIWQEPYMSIGHDTFIHEMMDFAGFKNILRDKTRYPEVIPEDNINPAYILLSSEPYPFEEKHIPAIQEKFPNSQVILVDGEMFSWYGSRMRWAPAYFLNLRKSL